MDNTVTVVWNVTQATSYGSRRPGKRCRAVLVLR